MFVLRETGYEVRGWGGELLGAKDQAARSSAWRLLEGQGQIVDLVGISLWRVDQNSVAAVIIFAVPGSKIGNGQTS